MKRIRIGINGFGRIGRALYRINARNRRFDVVAINDINPDIKNLAYLIKYDSTYGQLSESVSNTTDSLVIGNDTVAVHHERRILDVPWRRHEVDVVVDSSGISDNFTAVTERGDASGVGHFIVTNAPPGQIKNIIFGVNEHEFDFHAHRVVASSICDTIALAPIVKLITETHPIESGFLTTLHPWLSYQNLLDGASSSWSHPGDVFSHYALGRASTQNIIPKSTSAITAAEHVLPGLSSVIQSFSYRVPTPVVSSAVLILMLAKEISQADLVARFHERARTQKYSVIRNSVEPLTSIDYCGEEYSAVIDHRWTNVENGRHLKLVYWYDNEWGYASRVADLVALIGAAHHAPTHQRALSPAEEYPPSDRGMERGVHWIRQ